MATVDITPKISTIIHEGDNLNEEIQGKKIGNTVENFKNKCLCSYREGSKQQRNYKIN